MGRLRCPRPRLNLIDTRKVKPLARENKVAEGFYSSPAWKTLLAAIIAERGRRCEDPKCKTPRGPWRRIIGDHIKELKDGGAPLDKQNILLRCDPCHGRKTSVERVKRTAIDYVGI